MATKPKSSWSMYQQYNAASPLQGVYKDMESHPRDIPPLGWREADNVYVIDNTIKRFPGWADLLTGFDAVNPLIWGYDHKAFTNARYFFTASMSDIFFYDRTPDPATCTSIASGFTGDNSQRWQHAVINDYIYLVNGVDPIQKITLGATPTVAALASGDPAQPTTSQYICSAAGHLVLGVTTESAQIFPRRVRWSAVGNPANYNTTVVPNIIPWTPDANLNDAGYFDLPDEIGVIQGIATLGQNAFIIYGTKAIYMASYVGLPLVWSFQRMVVNEGLYMPYSLINYNNAHFFLDTNDFKIYNGGQSTQRIGIDKVCTWFFSDFNTSNYSNIYGFAHPILPIVGWVYVQRDDASLDFSAARCVCYNYVNQTWTTRYDFPHWMVTPFWASTQVPDALVLVSGN